MPTLPSSVSVYDSVPLIDFDTLDYALKRPANAKLRAWAKCEETDRRVLMFEWATFVVDRPNRNTLFLNDLASAYLLSFEATLQILQEERAFPNFETWLRTQRAYDVVCRGLRTLRHLEAHIRPGALSVERSGRVISRFANSSTGGTIAWRWPPITPSDTAPLRRPPLEPSDLSQFNKEAEELFAIGLMRHGVTALVEILKAAGP